MLIDAQLLEMKKYMQAKCHLIERERAKEWCLKHPLINRRIRIDNSKGRVQFNPSGELIFMTWREGENNRG